VGAAVVLGFGNCVDYEVTLTEGVLNGLVTAYGIRPADLRRVPEVHTERDLVVTVLDAMRRGEGGEHFVASRAALLAFAARLPRRAALGGTSVRAGIILARLGVPSLLHLVSLNRHVRDLLPPQCSHVGG
jgi:hypothetical protein